MPEALPSSSAPGPEPRRLEAGRGLEWWREAWRLFMKSPGMWLVLALIILVIDTVLGVLPFIGALISSLAMPGFVASWMVAARRLEDGHRLAAADIFTAFQSKPAPMLILGTVFLVMTWVVMALVTSGGAMSWLATSSNSAPHGLAAVTGAGGLTLLLAALLAFVVGTMLWFATALVMFHDMAPIDALKASWTGSLMNVMPFLVYGLIFVAAAIVASMLFGLGWIVLFPVSFLTAYTSYKDVFGG